jgi:hypothetical protein
MKPTINELTAKLEEKFGKLTPQAKHCMEDFYENYQEFINSIQTDKIIIFAPANLLANKLQEPKYTKYKKYENLSRLLAIAGLIYIFFNWKIGLGLILVSLVINLISKKIKKRISGDFEALLTSKIKLDLDEGMFDICQYYIAGILMLASNKGKAFIPLIPSYSLTGIKEYARVN